MSISLQQTLLIILLLSLKAISRQVWPQPKPNQSVMKTSPTTPESSRWKNGVTMQGPRHHIVSKCSWRAMATFKPSPTRCTQSRRLSLRRPLPTSTPPKALVRPTLPKHNGQHRVTVCPCLNSLLSWHLSGFLFFIVVLIWDTGVGVGSGREASIGLRAHDYISSPLCDSTSFLISRCYWPSGYPFLFSLPTHLILFAFSLFHHCLNPTSTRHAFSSLAQLLLWAYIWSIYSLALCSVNWYGSGIPTCLVKFIVVMLPFLCFLGH